MSMSPIAFSEQAMTGESSSRTGNSDTSRFDIINAKGVSQGSPSDVEMDGDRAAARRDQHLPTPKSSPSRSLLPAFNSKPTSHYPTPQSPINIGAYADTLPYSPDTPVRHGSLFQRPSTSQIKHISPFSASFLTPESSPLFPRKVKSSQTPSTPPPPTTPRPDSNSGSGNGISAARNGRKSSTPPPHSRGTSPPSGLSSPFVDRRTPAKSVTPKRSRIVGPGDSPMDVDDVFSPGPSTSKSSPSLQAPVPQRPVGGEIHRIRLQMAADQVARQNENESRRPEYLKRTQRPESPFDLDAFEYMEQETVVPNLGVTESPVKGRRIALFQETSEESFEQSLLAGGYPQYGHTPAYGEPQTPKGKGKGALSQRALDWLQNATPGRPNAVTDPEPDWIPSEKDIKKRKRLAAFEDNDSAEHVAKLHPADIVGLGRVLLDQAVEEMPARSESPAKKRANNRRKRGRAGASPGKRRGHRADSPLEEEEPAKPNWLDAEFPWSMRAQERSEMSKKEHEEKMRWIERFLDRDSDDEEDEADQSLGLTPHVEEPKAQPFRRGRGKMVPLKGDLEARTRTVVNTFMIPSDPADARAALLSKRSVRALAFRRRQQELSDANDNDDEVVCICYGRDDGRELVQCDGCRTWYHLQCIGINDITELGKEEDPWYCSDCLDVLPSSDPASEPTFVPTDDKPLQRRPRDSLFFQGSFQESPTAPWTITPRMPKTPVRGRDITEGFSTRSSWGESSRAGPTTPTSSARSARMYRTPTIFDGLNSDDTPFDPTSTPSRGIQMSGPFTTPKVNTWPRRNGFMQTPSRHRKETGPLTFAVDDSEGSSPYRTVYSYDDTPVRRSRPSRNDRSEYAPRRLWDSPLASRSTVTLPLGLQESPVMRMAVPVDEKPRRIRGRKNAVNALED